MGVLISYRGLVEVYVCYINPSVPPKAQELGPYRCARLRHLWSWKPARSDGMGLLRVTKGFSSTEGFSSGVWFRIQRRKSDACAVGATATVGAWDSAQSVSRPL